MNGDPLSEYPAMMTTAQVAEVTQIAPNTLAVWRIRGAAGPPFVKMGEGRGSAIRYPREDLRKYLAERTVRPAVTS